jgi:hypothetical protein
VDERVAALKEAMRRVASLMLPPLSSSSVSASTASRPRTAANRDLSPAAKPTRITVSSANDNSTSDAGSKPTDPVLERLGELARGMQRYLFAGGTEADIVQLEGLLQAAVHWEGVTAAALGSPEAGAAAKDLRAASKGRGGRTRITEAAAALVTAWKDAMHAAESTSGGSLLAAAAKFSGTSSAVMLKT